MVSLARAAMCIGRPVIHMRNQAVRGTVERVDDNDVWVKTTDGDVVPCIPAHLGWVSTLSSGLANAIEDWEPYHSAQVGFAPQVFRDDPEQGFPDEGFSNLAIVYSSGIANDDGCDRALFAICPMLNMVLVLSAFANASTARDIEELLGWAER